MHWVELIPCEGRLRGQATCRAKRPSVVTCPLPQKREATERRDLSAAAEERSGPEATKVAPDPQFDCGKGGSG